MVPFECFAYGSPTYNIGLLLVIPEDTACPCQNSIDIEHQMSGYGILIIKLNLKSLFSDKHFLTDCTGIVRPCIKRFTLNHAYTSFPDVIVLFYHSSLIIKKKYL